MTLTKRPKLRLVRGRSEFALIGAVRLGMTPPTNPLDSDALVLEEDTWQILAAGPELRISSEHPIRLWTDILNAEPLAPGAVLLRSGSPITMRAVVYDFDSTPCCRPRWINAALQEIIRICAARKIHALLMPLPGVRHGRLSPRRSFRLVVNALREASPGTLHQVLVACPQESAREIRRLLTAEAAKATLPAAHKPAPE